LAFVVLPDDSSIFFSKIRLSWLFHFGDFIPQSFFPPDV
jgi:hypothetical protein